MVKAMSFSSGVRTQRVFDWMSIVWFTSVSITGGQGVKLQALPQVAAECGGNATLTCNVSSSQPLDIELFSWLVNSKTVCQYKGGQPDPEVLCDSTAESLTLTLINVMPVNVGKYICKLQSKQGIDDTSTLVTVKGCFESPGSFINETYAKCSFTGVYPSGTVHWFQEDVNLTDSASTQEKMDQHGRYNVSSQINVRSGNLSLPYKCSLWIPSEGRYRSSQQQRMVKSSGTIVLLQWICVMVEMMMMKTMI